MKTDIFCVKEDQLTNGAEKYFFNIYQDNQDPVALAAKSSLIHQMDLKIAYATHQVASIKNGCLFLKEGIILEGEVFSLMENSNINEMIVFVSTIGHLKNKKTIGITEAFYLDAWGSAYLQGLSDLFFQHMRNHKKNRGKAISQPLGPGYFGIPIEMLQTIFHLVDASAIEVELNNKMMHPDKSLIQFLLIGSEPIMDAFVPCQFCRSQKNCEYCKYYRKSK